MATRQSIEFASQVWTRPETSTIEMDTILAEAIANSLDEYKNRINITILRAIQALPKSADASDFIRIQASAGIESLYGSN